MATLSGNVSGAGALRLLGPIPPTLQAPMLGLAWALMNVGLGWLGLAVGHVNGCLLAAGALDGSVLSMIVLTWTGEKVQGGIAGAFGGLASASLLGLDHLAGGQTLIARAAHVVVDSMLAGMVAPGKEYPHAAIEHAAIQGIWTAIIVVLAALVAKWMQDSSH